MVRVSSAVPRKKGRKRVLRQAKGQFAQRHKRYQQAIRSLVKGMAYSYRDRKAVKRQYRRLWQVRINAACREQGISYSRFINGLTNAEVLIDRKMLADLAISCPEAFVQLVELAKQNWSTPEKPAKKKTTKSTK